MSNSDVIANLQFFHSDDNIQVTDCYIIADLTPLRVEDAQSDTNTFANSITKKQAIGCAFEKPWEQSDTRERCQPKFAAAMHLAS
jgi:hypothetical protein